MKRLRKIRPRETVLYEVLLSLCEIKKDTQATISLLFIDDAWEVLSLKVSELQLCAKSTFHHASFSTGKLYKMGK